jgi:large subunit ribosomal protein L6
MSRIGKKPIVLPQGVTATVSGTNEVSVKGPKGTLKEAIDRDIKISIADGVVNVDRPTDQIRHRAMHGLYRSLIANMVTGVTSGFKKELELVGVGYRAAVAGQQIDMALGFSHNIIIDLPVEIKASAIAEKGQNPRIILESIDKQLLGQVAAKIRGLRKPEPYKGKGVRYSNEIVRRKAGKSAGK